jgi:archaellum component FlaF (FlaF/FlaG flagellin family)
MGFSVAASSAIIFIGFLFAAGILLTSMTIVIDDIKDDMEKYRESIQSSGNTRINIDNATNTSTVLYINITNTGATTLKVNEIEVLVNGSMVTHLITNSSVEGNNATNLWSPEETLYLEIMTVTSPGERVIVTTGSVRDLATVI